MTAREARLVGRRAQIRAAVPPVVEELRYELGLVAGALTGPDPEYALSLLNDVLRDASGAARKVAKLRY